LSETAVTPEYGTPPLPVTVKTYGDPPPNPFPTFPGRVSMIREGLTATNEPGSLEGLADAELVSKKVAENKAAITAIEPIFFDLKIVGEFIVAPYSTSFSFLTDLYC
jgi:hypothetical protein